MPVTKHCEVCNAEFKVPPVREKTARACSNACGYVLRGKSNQKRVPLSCGFCKKVFDVPECHADRRLYCSRACRESSPDYASAKKQRFAGDRNPRWKGGITAHSDGYLLQHAAQHPFAVNGYVFAHRLVAESALKQADPTHPFLVEVGGEIVLRQEIDVHHQDRDKKNNALENLLICTPQAHGRIHKGTAPPKGSYWPENVTVRLHTNSVRTLAQ